MSIVNAPRVSKTLAGFYGGLVVFTYALMVFFSYAWLHTPMGIPGLGASIVTGLVGVIITLVLRSLFQTRYILEDGILRIKTTRLIGGEKNIPLGAIESAEKTLIPLGIRLFGASFHGGYYQIPGLGRAFMAITNFDDGLLIKTKQGNFVITPKNPMEFKEKIEHKASKITRPTKGQNT